MREVEYQNTVGLNNVVVTLPALRERDLAFRKPYRVRRASDACEAPYLTCGPINAGVLSWNAGIFAIHVLECFENGIIHENGLLSID